MDKLILRTKKKFVFLTFLLISILVIKFGLASKENSYIVDSVKADVPCSPCGCEWTIPDCEAWTAATAAAGPTAGDGGGDGGYFENSSARDESFTSI